MLVVPIAYGISVRRASLTVGANISASLPLNPSHRHLGCLESNSTTPTRIGPGSIQSLLDYRYYQYLPDAPVVYAAPRSYPTSSLIDGYCAAKDQSLDEDTNPPNITTRRKKRDLPGQKVVGAVVP